MAINHYFNPYPNEKITSEQLLVEDLVIEALKIYSSDCYYLPRETRDQIDRLMGEDALKKFSNAYPLEFYVENVLSSEGEMDIISKFGLEIRDEMTLLVSRRRFQKEVHGLSRPREGDIIYVPFVDNFFEIFSVEHENNQAMFYTLGRGRGANIYVYALKVRQFVFSEEPISTGVEIVDESIKESYRPFRIVLSPGGSGNYDFVNHEFVYQGANVATATASGNVFSWSESTRTLDVIMVNGEFKENQLLKGATSNAQWTIQATDTDNLDSVFEDLADNKILQNEANTIIDWNEQNPFGMP